MDNQRLFAWALFGLLALMTYQAWQVDYGPQPATAASDVADAPDVEQFEAPGDTLPTLGDAGAGSADATPTLATDVADPSAPADSVASQSLITVRTDVLDVAINLIGGDIVSASLPRYPVDKDQPDELITLLSPSSSEFAVFRSGLTTRNKDNEPNHRATFTAPKTRYELADSADELVIPLTWTDAAGVVVTKRYTFRRGQYAVPLSIDVDNQSETAWLAAPYARIVHHSESPKRSMFNVESYSFKGPVVFDGKKYEKYSIGDLEDEKVNLSGISGGWLAAIEHHFLTALVPSDTDKARMQVQLSNDTFVAGYVGEAVTVNAGSAASMPMTLFIGPKLQSQLEQVSPRLPLTVDYGILTLLADPLFWVLDKVHSFVGNWGWSIILVTLLIKLIFYKLTEQSGRSIAKMRRLQPRLKAIQERYKDDRPKLSQAMMDLYKREKVNPAAGCLPILIQMPFFLAFYWVLLESVEMRQAPFMLWIQDLSSRDPLFILPFLMGVAMLMQQRLNPAPADPVQAKVMKVLPVVFTVFFAFFPAGLVLYWFTNTLLGVAQQWQINRVVEAEARDQRD
ncbi:MAG: membrane protein insertase YidC [Pseudomonadota bacterium]